MEEKELGPGGVFGACVVLAILLSLAVTALDGWPSLGQTLSTGQGSGWAQALGTVLAIIFSVRAATYSQRRQEQISRVAAEQAYDDLLLATADLMDKCAYSADKVVSYAGTPTPLDLVDMVAESSVLSGALQRIDFGRLRGPSLTEAVLVGIAAEAIFVRTLMQEEEASARRELNWQLVRHQGMKAVHHLVRGRNEIVRAHQLRNSASPLEAQRPRPRSHADHDQHGGK